MFRTLTHLLNPLVLLLAGTRLMPLYGVLHHRGRRSGKAFATPIVVLPTRDGFIVPMPWGEGTDWFRNVRSAGGCLIRWKGRDYSLVQPEVIESAAAAGNVGSFVRASLSRFHITSCLQLHYAS